MTDDLSPSQAAARIGATTRSVQRWIATGRLPARRVGGRWRVAIGAIDAFQGGKPAPRPVSTPIRRLFIANRGEIAARIARTCGEIGVGAVLAEPEGPDGLDLLDATAVVAAAASSGADALHPGFGFLAENADFAASVEAAGIRWVGPPPAAIRAVGDKAAARRVAMELGIPVLPGYDGGDQSDEALTAAARTIGLPLLVKPSAGGGGKGMRTVREPALLADALAGARREAMAAFGDDRLILERYLEGPRHVEIQVLFDSHGNGVHLGERDCSIQRRHQKILEETPSPAVDNGLRGRMGEAALALARAVGYASAGTCEFLLDDAGRFFFLEMNARLQVEHPVTEAVTGRDLVADQLRVAAGEALGFTAADIRHEGHAVEVRLYAEDAEAGFLPATGRVAALSWPVGSGIRIDAGVEAGVDVGDRFDPMLAKIIAHGRDRSEALDRLTDALDHVIVLGLVTNLRFLRWLVRQPVVRDGEARIDTLDRIWPPDDWAARTAVPSAAWSTAAVVFASRRDGGVWSGGWRVNGPPTIRLAVDADAQTVEAADGGEAELAFVEVGDAVHVDVDGRSVAFRLAPSPDVDRAARAALAHAHAGGPSEVIAPMPGTVTVIHTVAGDSVDAGDPVVTLEAMKMEHVVAAPAPGVVAELLVGVGDQVARGQLVGTIAP
ncbi:MAG TPA: biotin carboxylase N-terminal domain-containing protein [Vitreimonas sp.]|nr:biotin carboxylase N-terminal domain-containing protein [Vitreimonas sp.]